MPETRDMSGTTCPKCDVALFAQRGGEVDYSVCDRCNGIWIERTELATLLARYSVRVDVATLESALSQRGSTSGLLCPSCGNRFLRAVDVLNNEIDWCSGCRGVFLDRGELEQVSGGGTRNAVDPEIRDLADGVLTGILKAIVRAVASGALR